MTECAHNWIDYHDGRRCSKCGHFVPKEKLDSYARTGSGSHLPWPNQNAEAPLGGETANTVGRKP